MTPIKKALCLFLVLVLLLPVLTACDEGEPANTETTPDASSATETVTNTEPPEPEEETDPLVEDALDTKWELRFNTDGQFKIVVFSDIQDRYPIKEDTVLYMEKILDQEKPDLVLLTGDNHDAQMRIGDNATIADYKKYFRQLAGPMEHRKIPWAQVYGNHVVGAYNYDCGITKEEQQEIFESFTYNVSKAGTVSGVGNFVLPVLRSDSDAIGFNVFCMDSHDYIYHYGDHSYGDGFEQATRPGTIYSGNVYDLIHYDQINWYWETSLALEQYNKAPIPAMMMFHIPLYEFNYVFQNQEETGYTGFKLDPISAPELNAGLFWAIKERGDVQAILCGHDHTNDFSGTYAGITMAYCATIGSREYNSETNRGARIVTISEKDPYNFETHMVYCKDLDAN